MSDSKTYIVPDGNNNDLATMAMMSNGGMNAWANNPFAYIIWIYAMSMMNGGMWGNNNSADTQRQLQMLQNQITDNHSSDLLMQAISGNNAALQDFATRTGSDINMLSQAISGVRYAISEVGNQLGFSSERVINAVNLGDSGVIQALKDCCCNTQKSILEMGYQNQLNNERQTQQLTNSIASVGNTVERGFTNLGFQNQTQTCDLQNTIRDINTANTAKIIDKLDSMQTKALQDKIDDLLAKNAEQAVVINNAQQSAIFSQMLTNATSPLAAALNTLQNEVTAIQGNLPATAVVPANNTVAIPTAVAYQTGLLGPFNTTGTLWG